MLGLILRSGILRRIETGLKARGVSPLMTSLTLAVGFMALFEGGTVAIVAIADSLWPHGAEFAAHAKVMLLTALLGGVAGAGGLALLTAVLRAAPRRGWMAVSASMAVVVFCAVLIPPLTLTPASRRDRPVSVAEGASILAFVRGGGLPTQQIYRFESADPLAVDMEGLGPLAHAAVSRAALTTPKPETYAAIGHLLGHYRHGDLWSLALLWSAFVALILLLASKALASTRVRGADALAVIGLIVWAVVGVTTPVFNLFDQAINFRADDYALSLTHDPDALCRWLIATEAGGKADPSPWESLFFYDHPPLAARLRNAVQQAAPTSKGAL